jgi:hypothetical protein
MDPEPDGSTLILIGWIRIRTGKANLNPELGQNEPKK